MAKVPVYNKIKQYIHCPFCEEDEFDLEGLKYHLVMYCEEFKKIEIPNF